MSIFLSTKKQDKLVAVFNLGSSSVGGVLFLMQENSLPKIVLSVRELIDPAQELDADNFFFMMLKVLDKVASTISSSSFGAPAEIYCVLASPWYASQNRIIKLEKNAPFVFTKKLADSLIQKELRLFEEEHLEKYAQSGNKVRVLELKNIKVMLNGYEVQNPENQKTQNLEMTVFISMSGDDILSGVENVFFRHFHKRVIKFSSFLMASFAVVRSMYNNQEDFLLIDIGGEVTDISMVKKSVLRESVSYPIGINFILRNISSSLGCSIDEAKSMFSLYKDGHADLNTQKNLDQIISVIKTEWLKKFQASVANLSNDISIPATLFITIERGYADFFAEVIKTEQFNQYTLTESKFKINFLNAETLHNLANFTPETARDTCLIIDALYINTFLK